VRDHHHDHHDRDDHDEFDDLLLEATGQFVDELLGLPLDDLPERLQEIVRHTLITSRPDGTWPPAALVGDVLTAYLDAFDGRLEAEGVREDDLLGAPPPPWLAALRECADDPATLQRMLDELRAEEEASTAGIPSYPPPAELHIVTDPDT
jgi:hypothetical protein